MLLAGLVLLKRTKCVRPYPDAYASKFKPVTLRFLWHSRSTEVVTALTLEEGQTEQHNQQTPHLDPVGSLLLWLHDLHGVLGSGV
jgi:hypothetical protein